MGCFVRAFPPVLAKCPRADTSGSALLLIPGGGSLSVLQGSQGPPQPSFGSVRKEHKTCEGGRGQGDAEGCWPRFPSVRSGERALAAETPPSYKDGGEILPTLRRAALYSHACESACHCSHGEFANILHSCPGNHGQRGLELLALWNSTGSSWVCSSFLP